MRKLNLSILVGLVVALLGFGMVFTYGSRVDARVADGRETLPVLVAREAVPAGGTPADVAGLLELQQVPALYVAEGALASLDELQGQVLLAPITRGAQVTAAQFGEPGTAGAVQPVAGRVALAVSVGVTPGVARYVTPGSLVDVFVTYTGSGAAAATGEQADETSQRTKLFASGVRVMSVNVAAPQAAAGEQDAATAPEGEVVTVLDLTPAEAEMFVNAATLGSLYLALASSEAGPETHVTTGVTPTDVVSSNR